MEGMNFCQRRNDSIKRIISQNSAGSPFNLSAAWSDIDWTCIANAVKSYSESVSHVCSMNLSGTYPLNSAVLAPGGYIYLPPYMDNNIYKIDTNTDTVSVIGQTGSVGDRKYTGAAYAPDGCIYALPAYPNNILKINPKNDTYETFGSDYLSTTSYVKWGGAIAFSDGKIFGIPHSANKVLILDINTQTISTVGSLGDNTGKWYSGMASPQENVYGIPLNATSFLKINPQTLNIETFGSETSDNSKFYTPAWSGNGKCYCMSISTGRTSVLDPSNDTVEHVTTGLSAWQWMNSVLAPNGKIYGSPYNTLYSVMSYNPASNTITNVNANANEYGAGILAPNGCIYFIPHKNGTQPLLKVNPGANACRNFNESTLLSPFLNKF